MSLRATERLIMKVGTGKYAYELVENFAKLPDGETFGLISRVTTDSRNRLYVFQRKDPAVLVFDAEGNFLHSWGSGQFKRAHGFKIVDDVAYVTDQADNVALGLHTRGQGVATARHARTAFRYRVRGLAQPPLARGRPVQSSDGDDAGALPGDLSP